MPHLETDRSIPLWKALVEEFTGGPTGGHTQATRAGEFAAAFSQVEREFERLGGTPPPEYPAQKQVALEAAPGDADKAQDEFLAAFFLLLHSLPDKRAALCFSGGGIRSATFGLGVLQGLARNDLLDRFQYLSTVSGGGYLGGWFSAWIARHAEGRDGVIKELKATPESKLDPEPKPVRHLRSFSNYLNPRLGLTSADSWALAATVLRNMLLNWLMLLPLAAAALMVPGFCANIPALDPARWEVWAALASGFLLAAASVAYVPCDLPGYGDRRGTQNEFLLRFLLPLLLAAVALTSYWSWKWKLDQQQDPWWYFVLFGLAIHTVGWLRCLAPVKRGEERLPWRCPARKVWYSFVAAAFTGSTGGALAWWVYTKVLPAPLDNMRLYACLAVPALLGVFSVAGTLLVGVASKFTEDEDREWWARSGGWMLLTAVAWMSSGFLVLYGPDLIRIWQPGTIHSNTLQNLVKQAPDLSAAIASVVSAIAGVSGVVSVWLGHSAKTQAGGEPAGSESSGGGILTAATALFVVFLAALLGFATDTFIDGFYTLLAAVERAVGPVPFLHSLTVNLPGWFVFLAMVGLALATARFVNVNKFSLHAMYRNRLIRAYLGASRNHRRENPFTGFDPRDNIAMHRLSAEPPLHVVNMALNLVKGGRLAWQQRKAESFTVTRLHSGSCRLGYRSSRNYGDRQDGISLGTAVTISGAAASPNMGYNSSPLVTLLMTLFNARLGWWLGNPGSAGRKTWTLRGPNYAVGPIVDEALGLTTDTNPYVYLSDGGHFENLAIYEMVLRRCAFIVAIDAGCDPDYTFGDLGNAVRKIRVDMGIPIEFLDIPQGLRERVKMKHCAAATIGYSCVDGNVPDGMLFYIKPALSGDEPADVANYAASDSRFPHQPTSDQWFDEAQFESYRRLGLHSIEKLCETGVFEEFIKKVPRVPARTAAAGK